MDIVIGNLLLTLGWVVLCVGLGGLVANRAGFLHRELAVPLEPERTLTIGDLRHPVAD